MRQLIRHTAIVLLTLSLLIILWQLRQAILLFVLSLAVAAAFRPLIDLLASKNLPRGLALGLSYLSVIAIVILLVFAIGGPFLRDLQQATDNLSLAYQRILAEWPESRSLFQSTIAGQLPELENLYEALSGERGMAVAQAVAGVASGFFEFLSSIVVILILSMYWSGDRVHFERLWLSLLPVEYRTRAREIWREIEQGVGAYIGSELLQSVLAGVLLWVGFRTMGLEYPALLAVVGAFAWLIPWIGAVIAVIPPLFIGLGTSFGLAAVSAFYTILILGIMELVVEPRFFQRNRYSSLWIVLVVIAFAIAFGMVGVILAPPFAAAIQIFFNHYTRTRSLPADRTGSVTLDEDALRKLDGLKARLAEMQASLANEEAEPAPERINLIKRLDQLIEETGSFLGEKPAGKGG
jgi:predicted PurR-regulated permease PerM